MLLETVQDLCLSGTVPRVTHYETGDTGLVVHDASSACDYPDDSLDNMAIFYRSAMGLVVISGCTHSGLVNMVQHRRRITGCEHLHGIFMMTRLQQVFGERFIPTFSGTVIEF